MMRSAIQRRFDTDGYVAVPQFLSSGEVDACRRQLARFIDEVVPTMPADHVFYEDKGDPGTLKQLQRMHEHDSWFGELFDGGPRRLAQELLGTEVVGKNMQFFNKPPGVGQPTPPHQDGFYFKLDPPHALTMWLALDEVDAENGCVRYVKGSHRDGMRPHAPTGTLGFSQGMTDFGTGDDLARERALPAGPGDLLAHHALTIHRADGNASLDRTRRALGFIFYPVGAREDAAAMEAHRRQLAEQQRGKI